jgi:hypothetical protein
LGLGGHANTNVELVSAARAQNAELGKKLARQIAAIAAVPTKLVEEVGLIGPWAKITDEIQRWKQTS